MANSSGQGSGTGERSGTVVDAGLPALSAELDARALALEVFAHVREFEQAESAASAHASPAATGEPRSAPVQAGTGRTLLRHPSTVAAVVAVAAFAAICAVALCRRQGR